MNMQRIQKIISAAGFCSRRKAEELIEKGAVKCNNRVVTLGDKAYLTDYITIYNTHLKIKEKRNCLYIMLNKPRGYVTTMKDEKGRKTVRNLVEGLGARVYPVGRLDLKSEGLLLLTNDGDFANFVMHPNNKIEKTYSVTIDKKISAEDVNIIENGVYINQVKTAPCKLCIKLNSANRSVVIFKMYEGKKREIRNIVATVLKANVKKLKRIKIGALSLGSLKIGQYRKLSQEEVNSILYMQ